MEACSHCAAIVAEVEAEEGLRLEALDGVPLKPDALQAAMARLDEPEATGTHLDVRAAQAPRDLPAALAHLPLVDRIELGPDTWVAHLDAPRDGGWRTYVLCGPAAMALPIHGHAGDELIAVLEGGFDDGREFRAGDFAENGPGSAHGMRALADGRFVCVIASAQPIQWERRDRLLGHRLDI